MSVQINEPNTQRRTAPLWRRLLGSVIAVIVVLGVFFAMLAVPLPYVIFGPGPTYDVLGKQGDTQILHVGGAQSADSQSGSTQSGQAEDKSAGQLRMVTIAEYGGPGNSINAFTLLHAWANAAFSVYNYSDIYPESVTQEQIQQASSAQMESSHSTASVAAFEYLGYDIRAKITIAGASPEMGAVGKVQSGDTLVAITTPDGVVHPMDNASDPFRVMRNIAPGTDVEITVLRGGKKTTEKITTSANPEDPESSGSKLGIGLGFDMDLPLKVDFHLEQVGGPSAGLIFALGIIDKLTGESLAGDKVIAGTGALSYDGVVEPIGGIKQKMYGAQRDGAKFFLAPDSNCSDVVGNVPDGLEVYAVGTLPQAVDTTRAIATGYTQSLPTCEAVVKAQQSEAK